jgi:hypothetical protein
MLMYGPYIRHAYATVSAPELVAQNVFTHPAIGTRVHRPTSFPPCNGPLRISTCTALRRMGSCWMCDAQRTYQRVLPGPHSCPLPRLTGLTGPFIQSSAFAPDPRAQSHRAMDSMSTSLFESVRSGTPFYSEMGDRHTFSHAEGRPESNGNGRSTSRAEVRSASRAEGRNTSRSGGKHKSAARGGQGGSGQVQDDWGKMYPESVRT